MNLPEPSQTRQFDWATCILSPSPAFHLTVMLFLSYFSMF